MESQRFWHRLPISLFAWCVEEGCGFKGLPLHNGSELMVDDEATIVEIFGDGCWP